MPLLFYSSANKKDKHEKIYINRKNEDIRKIFDKLRVKCPDELSDKLCKYIRLGYAVEQHVEKGDSSLLMKIANDEENFLKKENEKADKVVIPKLDEYHEKGIGGKSIIDSIKQNVISVKQAANIVFSAKEILTEVTRTPDIARHLDKIKSKRDLKRKPVIKNLYTKVKTIIEDMVPLPIPINEYIEPPIIDENEWEAVLDNEPKLYSRLNGYYPPPTDFS